MSIEVKVVKSNFRAIRGSVGGDNLMTAAMQAGRTVLNYARTKVPVDTGNLRASLRVEPLEQGEHIAWVQIGTDVIYARIQELGGTIKPKTAKMLSWINEKGVRVFAKAVQIKAQPYLRPAIDEHITRIKWVITHTLNLIFDKVGKE